MEEHDKNLHHMDANDIYVLHSDLRRTSGLKDFKQELIDWIVKTCIAWDGAGSFA